ncbi:MAG: processing protein [Actinomycetota bacterium]|jgi:DNA processing protein|nr:processing protein [Actinomycetota bacterium]
MDDDTLARLALSRLVEPGQWPIYDAVRRHGAVAVWDALRAGRTIGAVSEAVAGGSRVRAEQYDVLDDVRQLERVGGRFVGPAGVEWPNLSLDWPPGVEAPPLGLFLRGPLALVDAVEQAIAVVGARASTVYGAHVAGELGLGIADRGWTVVSGGAYGVDGAAHGGALDSVRGGTIAVLACGIDVTYPRGHDRLLERIAASGLIVSEHPPGCAPTRSRFLVRNRLIAALSEGTVVVEAALRSGSLTTARQARDLGRHLMAVPGPVTAEMSAGCHKLLRNGATCVTSAADVLEEVGRLVLDASPEQRGPVSPRDELTDTEKLVLDAVPVRRWAGPASIAKTAGVPTMTVQQLLPPLQVAGLVEQSFDGWRLTALGAGRPARAAS